MVYSGDWLVITIAPSFFFNAMSTLRNFPAKMDMRAIALLPRVKNGELKIRWSIDRVKRFLDKNRTKSHYPVVACLIVRGMPDAIYNPDIWAPSTCTMKNGQLVCDKTDPVILLHLNKQIGEHEGILRTTAVRLQIQSRDLFTPRIICNTAKYGESAQGFVDIKNLAQEFLSHDPRPATWRDDKNKQTGSSFKLFKSALKSLYAFASVKLKQQDVFLHEIDKKFLSRYEQYMRLTFPPGTVSQYFIKLGLVLEYAVTAGYIQTSPLANYKKISVAEKTEISADELDRPISHDNLERIRNTPIRDNDDLERFRKIFCLQTWAGFSFNDLKVIPDVRKLIRKDLSGRTVITYHRAKTGELAIVPLFPETTALLEALNYSINPGSYRGYLDGLRKIFLDYFSLGNYQELGAHTGRHLFGNEMLERGFSMEAVSRMMGHKKLETTVKHYAKINTDKIFADYNAIKRREAKDA
jgi:integrase